jgi:hypothetical protein
MEGLAFHNGSTFGYCERMALRGAYFSCYITSLPPVTTDQLRINNEIRAQELRVIGAAGENLGVLSLSAALAAAKAAGFDLIEISPAATPPVAKIMDYGRFEYERSKKEGSEGQGQDFRDKGSPNQGRYR